MPRKVFNDLDLFLASDANLIMDQSTMVFATAAERDVQIPAGARKPGMMAFTSDNRMTWQYNTIGAWSGWTPVPGTTLGRYEQTTSQSFNHAQSLNFNWQTTRFEMAPIIQADRQRFIPPYAGYYRITGMSTLAVHATGFRQMWIALNTVTVQGTISLSSNTAHAVIIHLPPTDVFFNGTTDYFTIMGYQSSGGALGTYVTGGVGPCAGLMYVGPFGPPPVVTVEQPMVDPEPGTKPAPKKAVRDGR